MIFEDPPRRPRGENLVPMINVVFLLLIFFLMTAQIAPPEPFEVTPPDAEDAGEVRGELTLHLGPEGEIGFRDVIGEGAVAALVAAREETCGGPCGPDAAPVKLRADRAAEARHLAELMTRLGAAGFGAVELVTAQ